MRILDLAFKDLSQMFRDRRSLVFVVAMPILFTIFMGFAYKTSTPSADSNTDSRTPMAVVNPQPDTPLSKALNDRLSSSPQFKPVAMVEADALAALNKGDVAGVLEIPDGFNNLAEAGKTPQVKLIAQPTSANGQALYQWLRGIFSQLMSAVQIARQSTDAASNPAEYTPAFDSAWSKWVAADSQSAVKIEQAADTTPSSDWTGGNPYNQSSPGILVMFAIFGLVTSAQIVLNERKTRTLQRLMTTSMHPWQIIAGHMLAMFGLTFLQTLMLMIFGQLALNVNYFHEPLGSLLIAVTLGMWVSSVGLLIGVAAKQDQQVILFSLITMFMFSALGGVWFPLEAAGGTFAAIGRLTPSAWAMNGLQNLLIRGQGLDSTLLPALALLGYAVVFFGLALWRFKKIEL